MTRQSNSLCDTTSIKKRNQLLDDERRYAFCGSEVQITPYGYRALLIIKYLTHILVFHKQAKVDAMNLKNKSKDMPSETSSQSTPTPPTPSNNKAESKHAENKAIKARLGQQVAPSSSSTSQASTSGMKPGNSTLQASTSGVKACGSSQKAKGVVVKAGGSQQETEDVGM